MAEQYARKAEQHLAKMPANQQQQITKDENTLAQWMAQTIAQGVAFETVKKAAMIVLSRGRRR